MFLDGIKLADSRREVLPWTLPASTLVVCQPELKPRPREYSPPEDNPAARVYIPSQRRR